MKRLEQFSRSVLIDLCVSQCEICLARLLCQSRCVFGHIEFKFIKLYFFIERLSNVQSERLSF